MCPGSYNWKALAKGIYHNKDIHFSETILQQIAQKQ